MRWALQQATVVPDPRSMQSHIHQREDEKAVRKESIKEREGGGEGREKERKKEGRQEPKHRHRRRL